MWTVIVLPSVADDSDVRDGVAKGLWIPTHWRQPADTRASNYCGAPRSVVVDDVHRGLFCRGARPVDADVGRPRVGVLVPDPARVRGHEPARAGLADLVVARLAIGVGGVADAVAFVLRADVGQLARQAMVKVLVACGLTGGGAPVVDGPRTLGGRDALVKGVVDAA